MPAPRGIPLPLQPKSASAHRPATPQLLGAHAVVVGAPAGATGAAHLELTGLVAGGDGHVVLRHGAAGTDGPLLGRTVARYLLDDAGGADLGPWSPTS